MNYLALRGTPSEIMAFQNDKYAMKKSNPRRALPHASVKYFSAIARLPLVEHQCSEFIGDEVKLWCKRELGYIPQQIDRSNQERLTFGFRSMDDAVLFRLAFWPIPQAR